MTPAIFVFWWLGWGADGSTRWRDMSWWIAYPLLYLAYALLRAPIAGEVPYPFLDVARNGAWEVFLSALKVTGLFLVLSILAVSADRLLGRRRVQSQSGRAASE